MNKRICSNYDVESHRANDDSNNNEPNSGQNNNREENVNYSRRELTKIICDSIFDDVLL